MGQQQINQYAIERTTFGDNDYYDIDYYDGSSYQTAKIKGSVIKAGILAGTINVPYTFPSSDGTANQIMKTNGSGVLSFVDLPTPSSGDMTKAVYDPNNVNASAFDRSKFTGMEVVTGIFTLNISAQVNNLGSAIANFDTYNLIRIDTSVNDVYVTGIVAPSSGVNRIIHLSNADNTNDIYFPDDSSSSTSINRLRLKDGVGKELKGNETASFWYDHIDSRWKVFNKVG